MLYRTEALINRAADAERETVYCENAEHGVPGTPHCDAEDCADDCLFFYTDVPTRARLNSETDQEGNDQ